MSELVRPAPNRQTCILCRYSATDQFDELMCLFLFELAMLNKFQFRFNCPIEGNTKNGF